MKRITLMFFMFFMCISGFSQGLALEGFETTPWGPNGPVGWGVYQNNFATAEKWKQTQLGNTAQPPYTGNYAALVVGQNAGTGNIAQDWLVSPAFTLPATPQLRFWSRQGLAANNGGTYKILIAPATGVDLSVLSSYVTVVTWTEPQLNPDQLLYTEKLVDLPTTLPAGPVVIAFLAEGNNADRWLVDDVQVVQKCTTPVLAATTLIGSNTATLNWANPQGTNVWEIEVVESALAFTGNGITYNGLPPYTITTGLDPLKAYKFRIRAVCSSINKSDWSTPGTFTTLATPPANDECANATTLTVSPTNVCAVSTAGTVVGATHSTQGNTCTTAGRDDDDVWYQFVATSTSHIVSLTSIAGSSTDLYHVVYSGADCTALTQVNCSDPESSTLTGLTIGQTYKIRVFTWATTPQTSTFNICVGTAVTSQPNDNCANSTVVPVNPDFNCGLTVPGSVMAATASPEPNTCGGTDDDDVWFEFVATYPIHRISLINRGGSTTDLYHVLYSGNNCGALTQLYCSDAEESLASNLVVGQTYKIRVYSWTATANQNSTFNVCVGTPPPPPANDSCATPTTVPVNADLLCAQTVPGTIAWATGSPEGSTCAGTEDDDVWFEFTATNAIHSINLNNVAGSTTNLDHVVYSGACATLTQLYCSDANTSVASNLVVGQTYKIRVYSNTATAGQTTTFNVCVGTPPPPPVNDDCATATVVPVNADLLCTQTVPGTVAWATPSAEASTCAGSDDDDVWFQFVASNTSHTINLSNVLGSVTDLYHVLYAGDQCGTLTQLYCSDDNFSIASNLVIGQTYKIRVYTFTAAAPQTTTFNVCVGTPPPPPVNDNCATATVVPVNTTLTCNQVTHGTVAWSTPSLEPNTCGGNDDDDVWYEFVATNAVHTINLNNRTGSTTDLMHVLYSGDQCGALTQIYCSDPENSVATGLTVGQTYKIRVYSFTGTAAQTTQFDICIGTPPPPPVNDDCANAIVAPVNTSNYCVNTVAGTITSATPSLEPNTCGGTDDDDVWFEFVATNTTHYIKLLNVSGSVTDLMHVLYEGDQCGTLVQKYCSDPDTSTATGLVVGQTYKIRVYTFTATALQNVNFNLCVSTPATSQPNDDCATAIVAPVNQDSYCEQTTLGSVQGATASTDANACGGSADDDVWYEFTATHTQHYIALLNEDGNTVSTSALNHAVYSGSCGALTQIGCTTATRNSILNNLVIGQTYKIRIYSSANTQQAFVFRLCIGVIFTCAEAQSFCANNEATGISFPGSVGVPNLGTVSCLTTTPNPTFYFLQVEQSGNLDLNISQTSTTGAGIDVDFIAYGPFNTVEESCTGLTPANMVDCSYSAAAVEPFSITGAVAGEYYMIMITNFNGARGTINFGQTNFGGPGSGTTNCDIVCTADLGDDLVLCGSANNQTVLDSGIINATTYTWSFNGVVIPGATSQTYTATQSGNYSVVITKPACDNNPTDDINVTFLPFIDIPNQAVTSCGDENGDSQIDLTTLTAGILGTLTPVDFVVTYHLTQADATAGINPIDTTVPFDTTSQTIYVRVESVTLDTCFDVAPIVITISNAADATIAYAGSPFCSDAVNGAVTVTGSVGGTFTATDGLVIDAATGIIDVAASEPGVYTVTYTIAATPTCDEFITDTEVTIVEAPEATIAYAGTSFCATGTADVTLTGTTGGVYSSTTGLVIDPATGTIDLAASEGGTYTVTYTIAAAVPCDAFTATVEIEVSELPDATITYAGPFCSTDTSGIVTQTGTTGGTYSVTGGLTIDPVTGEINPSTGAGGEYTVTYTVAAANGCPAVLFTTTVTIIDPNADFIYSSGTYCQNAGLVAPVFEGTALPGTFTVDIPGLAIDPSTGVIDPAASTPSAPNTPYIVTNTVAPIGSCAGVTATATIYIFAAPIATFTYADAAYCENGSFNPSPVLDGSAGNFSATPEGLAINASSGTIDLTNSLPGTYTVSNTVSGTADCPSVTETTVVTIVETANVAVHQECVDNNYTLSPIFNDTTFNTDNVTFVWTDASGFELGNSSTLVIDEKGTYYLTVTPINTIDCPIVVEIPVESAGCLIQKGISPNNDGMNDNFDLTAFNVAKLSIFNRYGREEYSKTNYIDEWYGQTDKGNELPTGTYYYMIERKNGESKTGWIYINRQE